MCGISIAIGTKGTPVPRELIRSMNDKVQHRGPDDEGYYYGEYFAFGHRRLSIIDLTTAGHQPMQRSKWCITYNGEIYNYIEIREELKSLGYTFSTATDTEVILAAYEEWGVDSFSRLNGMWAFAIFDSAKNEIILCRDHFGIKPLYFTKAGQWFLAGSEIKQFTAVDEFSARLNKETTINFLVRGLLNYSDKTFFENVNELRPGHYLKYDLVRHEYRIVKWYDLKKEIKVQKISETDAIVRLRELFIESVRIRMRSDVQVGSCLSGGIDSTAIVSAIHSEQLANESFATITSCYSDRNYDEQQYSDIVTGQTGFTALKVYPDLDNLLNENQDLEKMIYHQDQPFSTASHYSEFNVFKMAGENRKIVMLDGQGSDEYLCGYPEFFKIRIRELLREIKPRAAYRLLKQKSVHLNSTLTKETGKFIKSAYLYPFIAIIKRIFGKNEYPWLNRNWQALAGKSLVSFDAKNIRDLSIQEIIFSSIPYQLHSEDRNSMMFSIESRLPFLCPRLVEFVIGLPSEYKIKEGYTKYVLRQAIREMPEEIKQRKDKMGFAAPDLPWVISNKEFIRKELEEAISRNGIFNEELLNRFDRFVNGELGYEPIYFRVMAFNRFTKIFKMQLN